MRYASEAICEVELNLDISSNCAQSCKLQWIEIPCFYIKQRAHLLFNIDLAPWRCKWGISCSLHTRKFLDLSFEIDIAVPQICFCRTKGVEFKREMKSPCNDDCHGDVRGVKGCNLMKWNFVTHMRNLNCKNLPYNSTNNSQSIFAEQNHPRNDAGSISLDLISMFDRKSTTFFHSLFTFYFVLYLNRVLDFFIALGRPCVCFCCFSKRAKIIS